MKAINKKLLLPIIIAVFAISAGALSTRLFRVNAESEGLKEEYRINETINIPDYTINYDGGSVGATTYKIEYPDGTVKSGRQHTLGVSGKYTVVYEAIVSGKKVSAKESFVVKTPLYSPQKSNTKTSAYYGKNARYEDKDEGLVISLISGDSLEFNKIIDLGKMTKNDKLLSFYITPLSDGMYDATRLTFRFTDVYDENNWIQITYRCIYNVRPWAINHTYIVAQSNGNVPVGRRGAGEDEIYINSDIWGYPVYRSFCGSAGTYNLFYDNADRSVWTDIVASDSQKGVPIADLDDDTVFATPWEGFTTGEVKMSVFASSYNAPSMNLVLTSLAGYDLTETVFADEEEPEISIDMLGNETVPNGVKGKAYKVFPATAYDKYSGEMRVSVNAYYKYGTGGQVSFSVTDGAFTPETTGEYTLKYTATDAFGNEAAEILKVNVLNAGGLDFTVSGQTASGYTGERIKIFDALNVMGEKGNVKVNISATSGNNVYSVSTDDYTFVPMVSGTYKVTVTVADHVETVEKQFDLTIRANSNPVFVSDVILPDYFITGQKYDLPTFTAYDLSGSSPKPLSSKIYVAEDGGTRKEVNGKYTVAAKNSVKVIYEVNVSGKIAKKEYETEAVNAITDGKVDITKYFKTVSGNATVSADDDSVIVKATADCKVKFINPVQVENFVTKFSWGDEDKRNFGGINIYFTDSQDSSVRVKFTYTWIDGVGYIAVNDGSPRRVPTNTTTSDRLLQSLGYINEYRQVYGRSTLMINVPETVYGESFNGFATNKAYVEYELFGVTGNAMIHIKSIDNQALFDFGSPDFMDAELYLKRSNGDVKINDKVTIYGCRAYDVLSSKVTYTLKVTDPSGNVMTATDGTLLNGTANDPSKDYVITATKYGAYKVAIVATDGAGNKLTNSYGFSCVDKVLPDIALDTSVATATVGATVSVRSYAVRDDVSAETEISVYVFVLTPSYKMSGVTDGKFVASEKGDYKVYYYCYDEAGNLRIAQYTVEVR